MGGNILATYITNKEQIFLIYKKDKDLQLLAYILRVSRGYTSYKDINYYLFIINGEFKYLN